MSFFGAGLYLLYNDAPNIILDKRFKTLAISLIVV